MHEYFMLDVSRAHEAHLGHEQVPGLLRTCGPSAEALTP